MNAKVERIIKGLGNTEFTALDEVATAKRIELNREEAEAAAKSEADASNKASRSSSPTLALQSKAAAPQMPNLKNVRLLSRRLKGNLRTC